MSQDLIAGRMGELIAEERRNHVLNDILIERGRQDAKWGKDRTLANGLWYLILAEEVGEVAQALLERSKVGAVAPDPNAAVRDELVQVAAVCVAWLEDLKRRAVQP